MAVILPGVRPIMSRASLPTEITSLVLVLRATTDGSRNTIPLPSTYTIVFAVPRSMPIFLVPIPSNLLLPFILVNYF